MKTKIPIQGLYNSYNLLIVTQGFKEGQICPICYEKIEEYQLAVKKGKFAQSAMRR